MEPSTKTKNPGFTLVEVIVVLVILAVLAAILIPSLVGYIDKARERSAIYECRSLVLAAQTIASEQYAADPLTDETVPGVFPDIISLAEFSGTLTTVQLDDRSIVRKLICTASNGITVTYENGIYYIGGVPTLIALDNSMTDDERISAAKNNIITLETALSNFMNSIFDSFNETYGEDAVYQNRPYITLNYNESQDNNGVNQSEGITRFYDSDGNAIYLEDSYNYLIAKDFYDSGLVDASGAKIQDCRVYFKSETVNGATRYTTEVSYCQIKVFDSGTERIYYYYPDDGTFSPTLRS